MFVESCASGIVGREKFARGKRPFYERMNGSLVVHPFRAAAPKLVESDRRAGSILDFRQIGHV
jgi:hypothetical protein